MTDFQSMCVMAAILRPYTPDPESACMTARNLYLIMQKFQNFVPTPTAPPVLPDGRGFGDLFFGS